MKFEFSRQIFEKVTNIKFRQNPSSGSRVVPCVQTSEGEEAWKSSPPVTLKQNLSHENQPWLSNHVPSKFSINTIATAPRSSQESSYSSQPASQCQSVSQSVLVLISSWGSQPDFSLYSLPIPWLTPLRTSVVYPETPTVKQARRLI
jgi:hypothetical protein